MVAEILIKYTPTHSICPLCIMQDVPICMVIYCGIAIGQTKYLGNNGGTGVGGTRINPLIHYTRCIHARSNPCQRSGVS